MLDDNNDEDNDEDDDTHPAWIIVRDGKYSVADKKIGLLKFDDLYKQQCLVLTHDCISKKAPIKIQQLTQPEENSSRYMLRNQANNICNLKIPNLKTKKL